MPFSFAYVLVYNYYILKHRIRFTLVLFGKGVWRCLESIELKRHEFYAFLLCIIATNENSEWQKEKSKLKQYKGNTCEAVRTGNKI